MRKILLFTMLLALASAASAAPNKLAKATIEYLEGNSGEFRVVPMIEEAGANLVRTGEGAAVAKTLIPKVASRIPWGGIAMIGGQLILEALINKYKEAGTLGDKRLDRWLVPIGYPAPYSDDGTSVVTYCTGIDANGNPFTASVYAPSGAGAGDAVAHAAVSINTSHFMLGGGMNMSVAAATALIGSYCGGAPGSSQSNPNQTLGQLLRNSPELAPLISDAVKHYVDEYPDSPLVIDINPGATVNQRQQDLIDPLIHSIPGSKYSDGDYWHEGYPIPDGNRPSESDGQPSEPWIDSPEPVDTNGDGVPNWRDIDDNGDGLTDQQQTETDQTAPKGSEGYARKKVDLDKPSPDPTPDPTPDPNPKPTPDPEPKPKDPVPPEVPVPPGSGNFPPPKLPRWDSSPVSKAVEEHQKKIASITHDRLPFAAYQLIPNVSAGIAADCQDPSLSMGTPALSDLRIPVCESPASQWMHSDGRALIYYLLVFIFLTSAISLIVRV